jgi:hypothetical protein
MNLFQEHPAWRVLPDVKYWQNFLYSSCETYIHWISRETNEKKKMRHFEKMKCSLEVFHFS